MTKENDLSPGMAQYLAIKEQYPDFLLFYRMGDFYEMFFEDAKKASAALGLTLTKRGKAFGEDVPLCGVPFHAYEGYLSKLIKQGFKVAICEQTEDPKEAKKRGSKSVVQREVIRLVTGGTITEESLLDSRKNNYLISIVKTNSDFGFAWIDLSTGVFYTQNCPTTAQTEVAELYGVLSRLQPEEILVADSLLEKTDFFRLLNEYREKLSVLPQARFNYDGAQKHILDFYQVNTLESFGDFSKSEIMAAGVVLDYVETTQKLQMPRINRPIKIMSNNFMEIDAATRHNLDLTDGPKGTNLLSVIDRTLSGAGARMLADRLNNPLLDVDVINQRLDTIEFFIKYDNVREKIREVMKCVPDIERSLARLGVGRGGPRDLKAILVTLLLLSPLRKYIASFQQNEIVEQKLPDAVCKILQNFGDHTTIINMLGAALKEVDDEGNPYLLPLLARDGGFIKRGYNAEFDAVCDLRDKGGQTILGMQDKYVAETGIDKLRIKYNNIIGYFIEVPNTYTTQLLDNPKFIHRQSVLNATRFTTVELTELENECRSAAERALAMELKIYESLVRDVMLAAEDILRSSNAIASLDVASSLAELAIENNYCRPALDNGLGFDVTDGRHPIVEAALKKDGNGSFVSNNCSVNAVDNRLWLITGPNMAGKSTFLRQNAIIAIMAQMGSYVPASSAHIGIVNKVFSRVGASDDLARGRSTFMVEMVETASILNRADEHSFVIIDEIGRGTATFDGLSIAWAVAEYLHNVNRCRTLFATHYHELTNLADRLPALSLHCMKIKEFNNQVVFLHEVIKGSADRSYGIHVANLAGLPKEVIRRADQVLKKLEKENQQNNALDLANELPLFDYQPTMLEITKPSAVEEALKSVNPDNLTAREALDKIYELKELLKGNE